MSAEWCGPVRCHQAWQKFTACLCTSAPQQPHVLLLVLVLWQRCQYYSAMRHRLPALHRSVCATLANAPGQLAQVGGRAEGRCCGNLPAAHLRAAQCATPCSQAACPLCRLAQDKQYVSSKLAHACIALVVRACIGF